MGFGNDGFDSNGFNSNGFDDFDGFDNDTSDGDTLDFGGASNSNNSSFDDFDADMGSGNTLPDDAFQGMYNNDDSQSNSDDNNSNLKKTAIIAIVIGVVIVIAAVFIGSRLLNKDKQTEYDKSQVTIVENTQQQQQQQQQVVDNNANNVINSGVNPPGYSGGSYNNSSSVNKDNDWVLLDTETLTPTSVEFDTEYKERIFTVTEIEHYARKTDNYVVIETRLKGSLSGISGTYEVRLPYNKGSQLKVDNEIAVWVLFGNYNGNKVVGDITWR